MQLKAFARVQGKPETWDGRDKIFVTLGYAYNRHLTPNVVYTNSHIEEKLILTAFVLLTVLIGLVQVWLTTQYYQKILENLMDNGRSDDKKVESQDNGKSARVEQNSSVKRSLYWSTAFVFCCFDICIIGVFIIALVYKLPNLTTTDYVVHSAFITRMVIMPILCIIHLGVAFAVHICRGSSKEFQCKHNCCTLKFQNWKKWISNIKMPTISDLLQVLALYSILIFIQTIGAAVIPLFILLLLYTFKVLSVFAFMASSTFCFIVLIAHILLLNAREGRKGVPVLLLQACIIVVFLAVIGVLVAFYLFLLSRGVDTKGLQGFLLSLIPSLALTVIGGYIKKVVLKKENRKQIDKS